MDRISKFLRKLDAEQRSEVEKIIARIVAGDFSGLDIKKLKGKYDEFRVRKGDIRIIFTKDDTAETLRLLLPLYRIELKIKYVSREQRC